MGAGVERWRLVSLSFAIFEMEFLRTTEDSRLGWTSLHFGAVQRGQSGREAAKLHISNTTTSSLS